MEETATALGRSGTIFSTGEQNNVMSKILVSDPIAQEGIDLLGSQAQVDVKLGMKPEELLEVIGGYEALVVRSETKVTREVIETGNSLRVVARAGIGVDNIDLTAATGAGIAVVNAPTGNTVAAAEHTVALMLALARNIPDAHHSVKDGQWRRSAFMGIEVRNKTLGIAGLGRVGSEVARRARSFGMRLVGFDPFVSPEYARQLGAELMTLDELLAVSDFITLHTPLTDSTHKLIGPPQLDKLKPGARLINVARGELVDEDALLEALDAGKLAGVALDVFSQEPPVGIKLVDHPRLWPRLTWGRPPRRHSGRWPSRPRSRRWPCSTGNRPAIRSTRPSWPRKSMPSWPHT